MSRTMSGAEVLKEHIELMGEELGTIFNALYNENNWLHLRWRQYVKLFGTNVERVELLNTAASTFFRVIQDTLFEATLLHLCRLTDPRKTVGHNNLTVRALPDLIRDEPLRARVTEVVANASDAAEFAREWRNRRIAHRDLALAIRQGATLAPVGNANVEAAIAALNRVFTCVEEGFGPGVTSFDGLMVPPTDAENLLYVLRDGLEAASLRRQRINDGNALPSDLAPFVGL